ncbi:MULTISPECIES: DUF72 domain-containing protein [Ralstonia]|uniref:Protein of uncharacterized function DUF72 n=1 Tax=Ralstonia mannitolilytica TaxID=105219 RepID=A0AAJ4ZNY2_9RALS|nr:MULTISPECIES: DUF72 domain-containing protein [Ralstonia]PLT17602.1 DUF72 domain-containing protein [Ralstonia mannitolilytica]CAG2130836.1 hypothetical protein LMG6866_00454 [Ralstonia mannitolilytica]CAJ0736254.1 hypothetical protein R77592_03995 [Ralstonia mannitolilytica]SUE24704.1 Protein of uncharacterised function DUF72 [Ralstonia mannitolilytica]SUE25391.1 Protein of uncharacterised function DUF72 [Ralstonia mannitolilytica]
MTIRIGISGWRYAGWRGVFYPEDLAQRRELEYASRQFSTIEINGSHYSLQSIGSWRAWYDTVPDDFVFAVKGPRYLTHMLRFRDETAVPAIANFFASGVLALRHKLGPFLWQFPPNYRFDSQRFERFLSLLPHDTAAARALARQHDARVKAPWFAARGQQALRHAVEVRHASFCTPEFVALLRRHGAALVVSHAIAEWPYLEDVTSDFVYLRLHGADALYTGAYSDAALDRWAERIDLWASGREPADAQRAGSAARPRRAGRDVYCYFDNDVKVQAPADARRLRERLALAT